MVHNVDILKDEDEFWFSRNVQEITSLQEIAPTSSPTTLSPSATPSTTPTGCSYLIDECPSKCWEVNEDERPPTCASIGQAFPFLSNCNSLPFMFTECPECCPDACLDDNRDKEGCDPTPMPSPAPSPVPTGCSQLIEACPSKCWEIDDDARPPTCVSIAAIFPMLQGCNSLPFDYTACPECCPDECRPDNPMFDPSPDGSPPVCSPTTMPSPIPTPGPSVAPTSDPSSEPSPSPSMMPSECSDLIEGCPYESCFLAQKDPSRPLDCTDPSIGRSECDAVPPPEGINCPICCASDCRADHPMFSHSPDGSPPECSPTMMPSPLPSPEPSSEPSQDPSPEPSPAPTPCAEILENCPVTCFSADFDIRPSSCALLQREDCDQIPLPMDCPTCCPTRCLTFDPDHCGAPTPLPSPVPSVVPSDMPSDCGKVIEQCPFASCFLPYNDPMRPGECSSSQIRREDCDVLPFPSGCPECCPFECRPDHPMFTASEDGSPPVCSPTMMPTTNPSSTPSNVPSAMPSDCAEIIDQCPHDTCFLPLDDESRPRDCIDPMVDREDCNVLPFPDGCPVCCPVECSPEHPMFSDRPDGNPPACSPTMMPSPIPTSIPSTSPSVVPSSVPSIQASSTPSKNTDSPTAVSDGPSVSPSAMPSDCVDVIDRCPYASCFLPFDDPARPAECTSSEIMRSDCNVVPTPPELGCPECCAYECRPNNPMFTDCSPTMLPSPSPSSSPSTAPSLAPSMEPTIMQSDTPSLEPSPAPTSCSYLIDECPEACWNIDPAQRYPACVDFNRPDCDDLPFDAEGCPECCPNQCLNPEDRINCSPTPVPSPVPSLAPSSVPSPKPSSTPSAEPSPGPSLQPSAMPTSCSHLIDECPTACWEVDPSDRPASCASVGSTVCRNIPTPIGVTCNCCPDECLDPQDRVNCSPTPLPSPFPSGDPTPMPTAAATLLESQKPSSSPSMRPSECADVIERCPFDACFLPYTDSSRPGDCTGSQVRRPDCDVLPFPDGCPMCCPLGCRPDSPMFDIQPDGSPPICSPTMMPSPSPSSEPSINASLGPSATPSEAPTACSHLIDECPVACWETDSSDRPPSCASTGDTLCNVLPLPIGIPCACCPDRCLDPQDRIDCSPTPLPSPVPSAAPSASPSLVPSMTPTDRPSPIPSPGPTVLPSPLPSPEPSATPTSCSHLIDECPTACWETDPNDRPLSCASIGSTLCRNIPLPPGIVCDCCPDECLDPQDKLDCSPTALPSSVPSSEPTITGVILFETMKPSNSPSMMPSECADVIDRCPFDACFLPYSDTSRPGDCTGSQIRRPDCDMLPFPDGCPRCCPYECRPDSPMFDIQPNGEPPVCLPTMVPSPSPSLEPSIEASVGPSATPSDTPTACSHLIDECPVACWEINPNDRPASCASTGNTICNLLPLPAGVNCDCCPDHCLNPQDRIDCSPTPLPSPIPSPGPTDLPSLVPSLTPTNIPSPAPSPEPTLLPTSLPSPVPSAMPTECSYLIDKCPTACFHVDPFRRYPLCIDFGRPDCDTLPFDEDGCPDCCPTECNGARDRVDCSPTPLPSPKPSSRPSILPSIRPTWEPSPDPSTLPSYSPSEDHSHGPSVAPSDSPTSRPSIIPSKRPSGSPTIFSSSAPTLCGHLVEQCPTACWEDDPSDWPASCASIGSTLCRNIPIPVGVACNCCPEECLNPQNRMDCSPTPLPSPVPSIEPTVPGVIILETQKPSNNPSIMPSECSDTIKGCPFEGCFLPYTDAQRPGDCTGSQFRRPDCDMLPFPDGCPMCCPYECRPDHPMFDTQPNGEPPVCSPTPIPSSSPSFEPSIAASEEPSATPSEMPTSCSHLLDECPVSCWEINPDDRPVSCGSVGDTVCNVLPLPIGVPCACCPDKCLDPQDRVDCSPTPLPSPVPSASPSALPSLAPSWSPTDRPSSIPSQGPSKLPTQMPSSSPSFEPSIAASEEPSATPSEMPTSCSHLLDECPVSCWEINPDDRPVSCGSVGDTVCNVLPLPIGVPCACCPDKCLDPQDRVDCSPTPLPSPVPSASPSALPSLAPSWSPTDRPSSVPSQGPSKLPTQMPSSSPSFEPSIAASEEPSATPSEMPTSCSHLLDECPVSCWEINPDDRPVSCGSVGDTVCNVLPLPIGVPCACCPDKCLDPQDRVDCSPTPLPSPVPSASPSALPSLAPSWSPTDRPSLVPSIGPSNFPTLMPSSEPSSMPTSCGHLVEQCPTACWEDDPSDRPASCASFGSTLCRNIPIPVGVACNCCPEECLNPQNRMDCSPTPLPSPVPSIEPTVPGVIILETQKPSNNPSIMPSECSDTIKGCPFEGCFLPYTDAQRPGDCTGSQFRRPDCDMLPFPDGCPMCCPYECRPDHPMFDTQPNGEPPVCSPTPIPSSSPSFEPSIAASEEPSATPSEMPTSCSHLLDECPVSCWEINPDDRPVSCGSVGDTVCNVLPLPIGVPCACCPDKCLDPQDRVDCSPTPLPSPVPSASPSALPSLAPSWSPTDRPSSIPSQGPSKLPTQMPSSSPSFEPSIAASEEPSATPSEMPTSCSHLLDECPVSCWEINPDDRPVSCGSVGDTVCNVLPLPIGVPCACCPDKCLDPQDQVDCSPTPLPSPVPSASPSALPSLALSWSPTDRPSFVPSEEPTVTAFQMVLTETPSYNPSMMPSDCADIIDRCPFDSCFLPYLDASRPLDCTGSGLNLPDCDMLPFPDGCPMCCPSECRPDSPIFDTQPNGDPPVCSPTMLPSPVPSSAPSVEASGGPSAMPSAIPSLLPSLVPSIGKAVGCGLNIDIDDSCMVACNFDVCVERPFRMQMQYIGGGCEGTSFKRCPSDDPDTCSCTKEEVTCSMWNENNSCEDFDAEGNVCNDLQQICEGGATTAPVSGCGPPPSNENHIVHIEAFGGDELYFAGPVIVNTTWEAVTRQVAVEAYTDIFTYQWDDSRGKGRLMQHVVFDSSCTKELVLGDQFGCQQLHEMDSYCQPSCNDGGCEDITEGGSSFGRRRISLLMETTAEIRLDKLIGSIARSGTESSVQLDHVLGLYTPVDFSAPSALLNFSKVMGQVVPPSIAVSQGNLTISPQKNYSVASIVTGFLNSDRSIPCQQIAEAQIGCRRVPQLPCQCPPCLASQLSTLPPVAGSPPSGEGPPPSGTPPSPSARPPTPQPTTHPTPQPTAASIISSTLSPTPIPPSNGGKGKAKSKGKSGKSKSKGEGKSGKSKSKDDSKSGKSKSKGKGKSGKGKSDSGKSANKSTKGDGETGQFGKSDTSKSTKGKSGKSDLGKSDDKGKSDSGKSATKSDGKSDKSNSGKSDDNGKSDSGKSATKSGKSDLGKSDQGKSDSGKSITKSTKGDGKSSKSDSGKSDDEGKSDSGKSATKSGKSDSGKSDKGKSDSGKSITKSTKGDGKSGKSDSGKSDDEGKSDSGKSDKGKSDSGKSVTKSTKGDSKSGKSDLGKSADKGKSGSGKSATKSAKGGGKSGTTDSGKNDATGKSESGKSATKSGKSDSGKADDKGKSDSGKSATKSGKSSSGKSNLGKSNDTGKSGSGKSATKSTKGDSSSGKSNAGKSADKGKSDSGKSATKSTKGDSGSGKSDSGKSADKGKSDSGKSITKSTKGDGKSSKSDSGKSADKGKNDSGKSITKSTKDNSKSSKSDSGKSADKGKSDLGKSVTKSTKGDGKSAKSNSGKSTGNNDSGKTDKADSTKNDAGKSSKDDAGKTDTGKIGKWGGKTGQSDTGTTDPFDQLGGSDADSGKTGSGPKGSGKNPVSLPTSAPKDSGKSKDSDNGKAGKNNSGKNDSGKTGKDDSGKNDAGKTGKDDSGKTGKDDSGKNDAGKTGKNDAGKNDNGKTSKDDSGKNDTGKAGKTDTGKIGKWGGKTGQSDTGTTDPFDQLGGSDADSGKTGSGPKGSGKNPVSLPTSAPKDSGKSKDSDNGKAGKNNSGKNDSGKTGKDDSGKNDAGKTGKDDSGKTGKDDSGKNDAGKTGKNDAGKNDNGKTSKDDSGKNDTGKAGKTDTGKIGKWGGKTGQSDTGTTDPFDQLGGSDADSGKTGSGPKGSGKNPVSLPTSAPKDSGKSKDSDNGKAGKNNSGKNDSGKTGKDDSGKNDAGKTGKDDSGKTGKDDSGKNDAGKTGKNDAGKNDNGKTSKDDSGKNDTGKAGKTDTGKIGKWGGKTGQSDTGTTDPFDQLGGSDADSGKTGSGPKGSGKNPVSLPTSAPKDSGKSKDSDNGKAGKNNSGKNDSGKTGKDDSGKNDAGKTGKDDSGKTGKDDSGKNDAGKTGKNDAGKNDNGKTSKDDSGKNDTGKAGKTDTGKIGKWGGKTGQSDTGTTDPFDQLGGSDADSGKTGSGPKGSGKNPVSLPTSAPKDSGKSKDNDNGKAGKNNSGKNDSGKTGKDDSGKSDDVGKTGKSDDTGKTGKNDSGKTGKDDSGNNDAGKNGKTDSGKNDDGKTGKADSGKTDAGKNGKNDHGKTSAGKTGKNDVGKTGKNDSGKTENGKNPVHPPTLQGVSIATLQPSSLNIVNHPIPASSVRPPVINTDMLSTLSPTAVAQLMGQAPPSCNLDLTILNQCIHECGHEVCTETPYLMQMRYNGGGCYGTSFKRCRGNNVDYCSCDRDELPCSEWNSANICVDFTMDGRVCNSDNAACADQNNKNPTPGCGPPTSTEAHKVYIEAFGGNELYFSGPVSAGSTWELSTEGEKVADNTDIFTYEWIDGIGKGRILQHVVFHSSCSDDMSAGDRFGSQQLLGFDAFCDVSCRDGGCKEVTENGNTFGRRHTSSILEDVSSLRLGLGAGSMHSSVQLEHVLTMYTPSDFSAPPQIFNFSDATGDIVQSAIQLDASGLQLSLGKNYSAAAIVTGFLNGDRSALCQQVAQSQLSCEKRATLQCGCPPCLGESLADLSGAGGSPTPNAPSKTKPSNKSNKDKDKGTDKGKNPPPAPKPTNAPLISPPISRPTAMSGNPPPVPNKGSGKNYVPANTKAPKDSGTESSGKETKKMTAITRSDGK
ncbi:unnamed protein product [Cylindrotheca closterium]|uniref:Circumsporozoite protein n=1 Tax=Cylindrotheca closterium TaxID=2856 RepID=A0AAD2JG70_9STRA|nr:unnamed protein product [Cylindrotheca closterium]